MESTERLAWECEVYRLLLKTIPKPIAAGAISLRWQRAEESPRRPFHLRSHPRIGCAGEIVRHAALESRDTAHLEVCATLAAASPLRAIRGSRKKFQKKLAMHLCIW